MLIDPYGRKIRSLRASITKRCNLNCIYCHMDGQLAGGEELSLDEIKRICNIFPRLGVKKIRISGGEPLVRKDCVDIIAGLKNFDEISMTTNGVFLADKAEDLKQAGLKRVNISIDSLKDDLYSRITGGDRKTLLYVKDSLEKAVEIGLTPVKINMVVLDINQEEIHDFIDYILKKGLQKEVILQLIELIDIRKKYPDQADWKKIEAFLNNNGILIGVRKTHNRKKYLYRGVEVELVRPIDAKFCMGCSRLRLTADGFLKPCLLRNDNIVDLKGCSSEEEIERLVKVAVARREPYYKGVVKKHFSINDL
ncbi:MAG: GTP 3',8-cyclase MoaA [Candidatus Methanoliparum thermophilum]|uniref:Probable GTP 3',8-cyclase n=1 Tax=Methanoliparum thermophilum TaxID=2491083 RepID=A0A520KS07_METT2|nr:GTP 3',8-cyclase MoaA [Candidatus Methanoliparum sp. LAM-1]RZN64570.1 MAG: GTP 3',8-cyclase MoaA [Candidatus Methanoliparum thermophilum]BDC35830.1 GTP 3',8-cyclase MoaA [Candidatus Methanoliparum sp. LAM-1]